MWLSYQAYFPGGSEGISEKLDKISSSADVAVLKLAAQASLNTTLLSWMLRSRQLHIGGRTSGVIGYPTVIEGFCASGNGCCTKNCGVTANVNQMVFASGAAERYRPPTTQGHIGYVLQDRLCTTQRLVRRVGWTALHRDGKGSGREFSRFEGIGGSNFAVPARYAKNC